MPAEERTPFTKKDYPNSTAAEIRKWNEEQTRTPVFADITRDACAFLEAACNVRYFEQEQICKDGDPRSKTYGQIIDPIYNERDLAYFKQRGMKPQDVQRLPRSGDWHGFLPEEIPEGQTRVIVNLDTLEYIDPVKFRQAPTLAGMVSLAPKDRDILVLKK